MEKILATLISLNRELVLSFSKFISEFYLWDTEGKKASYYEYDDELKGLTSNMAIADIKDETIRLGVNCRCPLDDSFENIPAALEKITSKYGYEYVFIL